LLNDFSVKEIKDLNVLLRNENEQLKWELDRALKETVTQRESMEKAHRAEVFELKAI